jgi:hypothetical protein
VVACTPHPGFGTVRIERPAYVQVVDLSTCRQHTEPLPKRAPVKVVVHRTGSTGTQTIVSAGKPVLTIHERFGKDTPAGEPGPILLLGSSPDRKWILYSIDPMGSASIVADGVAIRAVSTSGGRSFPVAFGLGSDSYRAWCGGKLVMTAGGDRITTHHKWLVVTGPPDWRARVILRDPRSAFASLVCSPDGRSVVVESAPATGLNMNARSPWSIWRVALDGTRTRLTTPPRGISDESPQVLGSTVYFVRNESLYALRGGRIVGPLLRMPHQDQFFGHAWWAYTVTR